MFFVVMPNGNHREHLGMFCIVMPSIFVNCPALICLPNIASYLRERPLVICGPWSYLLHTVYNTCCNHLFTVPCNSYCFPHCAINSLFCKTGEIDNLSVSSWAKFWFVSVQVPLCWRHHVNQAQAPSGAWGGVINNKLSIDHQVLLVRLNLG